MNGFTGQQPRMVACEAKRLAGKRLAMSLQNDQTGALWKSFMPLLKTIGNRIDGNMVSLQVYPAQYFEPFDPAATFTKWAGVFVDEASLPQGLEALQVPAGLYAVFHYRGPGGDSKIFRYIFSSWLPASPCALDNRPHFECLGPGYRNNDPDSEEEIWIPVKKKNGA